MRLCFDRRDFIESASVAVSHDGANFGPKQTFTKEIAYTLPEKPILAVRIEFESDSVGWVAIREILAM